MAGMAAGSAAATFGLSAAAETERIHNLALKYMRPATEWTQALPVGDGVRAAMVFGGVERERLQLNEGTLWAGRPYVANNSAAQGALPQVRGLVFAGEYAEAQALADAQVMAKPLYQMPYQALGDLTLDFPGLQATADYARLLDLDAAVAVTRFAGGGGTHERRVVAAPGERVIAMRLRAPAGALDVDLGLSSPHSRAAVQPQGHDALLMTGVNDAGEGVPAGLYFAARLLVQAEGGRTTVLPDGRVSVRDADAASVWIAMATSFRRFDDVSGDPEALTAEAIAGARRRSYAAVEADATARHRRLFRRVTLDLGRAAAADWPTDDRIVTSQQSDEPALAALYFQYARYLLIACSQPGGQPATLQGLWNDRLKPPWGSKYTININTQMNYWPAHVANLAECTEPLVRMVRELAITGERTAREMYGARGWVCHHNTDLWRATAPIDGAQWGLWPTGGAWLCTHLWEHWDYTRDRDFLHSVYPVMARAAHFFLDVLMTDPHNGALVTNPSISPENVHPFGATVCAGPSMDMSILRDLFEQTAAAADLLGLEHDFAVELRAARERLAPLKIGKLGQLQEWQDDWDADAPEPDHRHTSHLYALHPSHQISLDDTPTLAAAARRSLELRGDRTTGWASAWRINLWARLGDGERAHAILRFLLGPERTYPNMFDAHPPFQIDGNFGGAAGILEMLMRSEGDTIHLLPALPRAWPRGSFTGLRARGACGVDLSWQDGRPTKLILHPELDGRRLLLTSTGERWVTLSAGRTKTVAFS